MSQEHLSFFELLYSTELPVLFSKITENGNELEDIVKKYCQSEGFSLRSGFGFIASTGTTVDGYNAETQQIRAHTTGSKESLLLALLAIALRSSSPKSNQNFGRVFCKGLFGSQTSTSSSEDEAELDKQIIGLLITKLDSYIQYQKHFQSFGGFLPWVHVNTNPGSNELPIITRKARLHALDNAQFLWSLVACYQVLKKRGESHLAQRYKRYIEDLCHNLVTLFWNDKEDLPAETTVIEDMNYTIWKKISEDNYYFVNKEAISAKLGRLQDPFEGELMLFAMEFLAKEQSLTKVQVQKMWKLQQEFVKKGSFRANGSNVDIQFLKQGHFSSHEQWKMLVLPYNACRKSWSVFHQTEQVRTHLSYDSRYDMHGLIGTANTSLQSSQDVPILKPASIGDPDHHWTLWGVQRNFTISPYGAFPVILANREKGLKWLMYMLRHLKLYDPVHGTLDATSNGSPVKIITWDVKGTIILSICSSYSHGLNDILYEWMTEQPASTTSGFGMSIDTMFDRFRDRIDEIYSQFQVSFTNEFHEPTP